MNLSSALAPSHPHSAGTAKNGGRSPRAATCPGQEMPKTGIKEMRGGRGQCLFKLQCKYTLLVFGCFIPRTGTEW